MKPFLVQVWLYVSDGECFIHIPQALCLHHLEYSVFLFFITLHLHDFLGQKKTKELREDANKKACFLVDGPLRGEWVKPSEPLQKKNDKPH